MFFQVLFNSENDFIVNVIVFIILATALIFSLVMHELGHAYSALLSGDRTAQANGRLSFNPLKHLDPLGFFMLIFVGFGYAKPVPINPYNFKNKRKGMFFVSIAGVSVNIVLAFLASGFFMAISSLNSTSLFVAILSSFFFNLTYFNLVLCFFNLLPLFPLDGFRLVESVAGSRNKIVDFLHRYSMYILIILVALGVIVDRYYNPNIAWWQYVDVLGLYLRTLSNWVSSAFFWFWGLIF